MDTENDRLQKALQNLLGYIWGHPTAAIVPYTTVNLARINRLLKSYDYDLATLTATLVWPPLQHMERIAAEALGYSHAGEDSSTPPADGLLDEALETVEELRQQRDGLRASTRYLENEALRAKQAIVRHTEVIAEIRSRLGGLVGDLQGGAPNERDTNIVERRIQSLAHWMDTEVPAKLSNREEGA